MNEPLWSASEQRIAGSILSRFIADVGTRVGSAPLSYEDLYKYSLEDSEQFWAELWRFAEVKGDMGAPPYLVDADRMPGARFFPDARLNYAENALAKRRGNTAAIVFWGEEKVRRRVTWGELRVEVAKAQAMLRKAGVKAGDRIAAILPNLPESIVCMLATASVGAVWSSCSPDFGVQGVLDRFAQIAPKVLIAADGYYYNGKRIDISEKLAPVAAQLPTVERVVVLPYLGRDAEVVEELKASFKGQPKHVERWSDVVTARSESRPRFVRLPFGHPLFILFSSGTTGMPKCIVHSAGGVLLKHICEHRLHADVNPGDRLFYFTTLGWMMWNWLVSGLASGATLLLYDGSPFYPSGHVLWDYAAAERCTHFGTSAKYIDSLKKAGFAPARSHDLSSLRSVLSTGSPLAPESFEYVYDAIKRDIHLASISGGTDICGCFVLGNPAKPVWRGEIQGAALGLDVDVIDHSGRPVRGDKGELVCRNPFPSMPIGFWNDPDGQKYQSAYFARFPGLWHQGDFAQWTEHGGIVIHGRSDATLNPGGVRIGTAEIYRQVELLPEIYESVVVGQEFAGDVRVLLFVVMKLGARLDDELRERIKTQIRRGASPRHVPAKIIAVADIPRTKSGKITELAVRDIIIGREIKNKEALANPEALELFRGLKELSS
jgi:acetoacetyl-CoA synthetase